MSELKEQINLNNTVILITGAVGFVGANVVLRLVKDCNNSTIIGIDNFSDYYDIGLKEYRLAQIESAVKESLCKWVLVEGSIGDKKIVEDIFRQYCPEIVVNLAAQAGVRYSITNPDVYVESNLIFQA